MQKALQGYYWEMNEDVTQAFARFVQQFATNARVTPWEPDWGKTGATRYQEEKKKMEQEMVQLKAQVETERHQYQKQMQDYLTQQQAEWQRKFEEQGQQLLLRFQTEAAQYQHQQQMNQAHQQVMEQARLQHEQQRQQQQSGAMWENAKTMFVTPAKVTGPAGDEDGSTIGGPSPAPMSVADSVLSNDLLDSLPQLTQDDVTMDEPKSGGWRKRTTKADDVEGTWSLPGKKDETKRGVRAKPGDKKTAVKKADMKGEHPAGEKGRQSRYLTRASCKELQMGMQDDHDEEDSLFNTPLPELSQDATQHWAPPGGESEL